MQILTRQQIDLVLAQSNLLPAIEDAFVAYSNNLGCVPPVGELLLEKGEVHIKYGYIKGGEHYVIKIASGFYQNPQLGLPSSNGLMLLFSQQTGELVCTLHDEGCLTDHRTALAGAICAKYLSPKNTSAIGIIGTGIQAQLQAIKVSQTIGCRSINIWGRCPENSARVAKTLTNAGLMATAHDNIGSVTSKSEIVITTTPAKHPLLFQQQIPPGTLVIAVGSDTPYKQELDIELLEKAHRLIVDSRTQSQSRGEVSQLLRSNKLDKSKLYELGEVIAEGPLPAKNDEIVIADLTGIALQDLKIAEAVYHQLQSN